MHGKNGRRELCRAEECHISYVLRFICKVIARFGMKLCILLDSFKKEWYECKIRVASRRILLLIEYGTDVIMELFLSIYDMVSMGLTWLLDGRIYEFF